MIGALDFAGVHIFDLQYGDTKEERRRLATGDGPASATFQHVEGLDLLDDFEGVAALAGSCDLVVTTSNAVAHIAAAIGVPVWVVLPWAAGRFWYWRCEGERNPWYPEARLFVADPDRGWAQPLASIRASLGALLAERG
jgi:ADP-heptose:LPS heptosyltransferase